MFDSTSKVENNPKHILNLKADKPQNLHRSKFKTYLLYGISFIPLFISHHPECEKFKRHTIKCGKVRLCIGCFIGYSASLLAFLAIMILNLNDIVPAPYFLWSSIPLLGTLALSFLHLTENKKVKITQKICIGLGATFLINWIMLLPNPKETNLIIAFIVVWLLLTALNLYHAYGFCKTCDGCETPFYWGHCEGFRRIRENMEKNNLHNFLTGLDQFSFERKLKNEAKERKK